MSNPVTCLTCPSYLDDVVSQVSQFRRSFGAPACGRYGHMLGRPGLPQSQLNQLATKFASKCDSHGVPLPVAPVSWLFQLALPSVEARENTEQDVAAKPAQRTTCTTCRSCQNYISETDVQAEIKIPHGLCAAKGKLILGNRQAYEARDCEWRNYGNHRYDMSDVTLLPEYDDAFGGNVDPIKAYLKTKREGGPVEPHEYETDLPVTEEQRESGIRAWRKVPDPDGSGNLGHLPIYDIEHFSTEEQAKIPRTGQDEHPELYIDHFGAVYLAAVAWTELDETPAAWGEAGVGKTELFRHLAWLMCLPFERISITAQTEIDDLIGKMMFLDGETRFQYGRLPKAWCKPCVICIDEPNVGNPEVWQALRPLTDNSKQLIIDQNNGERIKRHDDCYMGMAMNPAWDPKNVGTQQIGDADASRLFHLYMGLPDARLEREIITNRVKLDGWEPTSKQLDMVMGIAIDLRALCEDGTLPISWGIRPQIKVMRAMRWFSPLVAYRRAIGDYLEPDALEQMLNAVRAHIPGETHTSRF